MANLIPAYIDPDDSPPGEVVIFDLLRTAAGTEDWTVLHSLDIPNHVRQVEGELDFLILVPGGAAVFLEVKSHTRVRRDSKGLWHLGADPPTIRSPFRQAAEAMRSTMNKLKSRNDLRGLPCVSAVAFPLCEFGVEPFEWEPWQVFDESAIGRLGITGSIRQVVTGARSRFESAATATWFDASANEPSIENCKTAARILRPSFEQFRSPKARRSANEAELKKFTTKQFEALDLGSVARRAVFTGAAGTGKTLLAIESARRSSLQGQRTLLTCYNTLLGRELAKETAPLAPLVRSGTLHSLMHEIADVEPPSDPGDPWFEEELPVRALDRLLDSHEMYQAFDTVVVDEAQDLLQGRYLDVFDLLLKGGLRGGSFRMFGDFEGQSIYSGRDGRDLLATKSPDAAPLALTKNCRNRPRVAQFAAAASRIPAPYLDYRRPDDGVPVNTAKYSSAAEQLHLLQTAIDRARSDGFQLGDIAILSTLKADRVATMLGEPHRGWTTTAGSEQSARIQESTIHAFKGLEAPCVIVTDVSEVSTRKAQQLLYIAASRATEHLTVLLDEAVAGAAFKLISTGTV